MSDYVRWQYNGNKIVVPGGKKNLFGDDTLHPWYLAQGGQQFRAVMGGLIREGHAIPFFRDGQGKLIWSLVLVSDMVSLS